MSEKMSILKMIEEGKITAAEGAQLLGAVSEDVTAEARPVEQFRIKVTNTESGAILTHITIPIRLVTTAVRMGAQFVPGMEEQTIIQAVREAEQGKRGKVLSYSSEVRPELIEIFAE